MPVDELERYLKHNAYKSSMAANQQTIPARAGTATFVPAGSTIKIINSSGTQPIDTWAFALPSPPKKDDGQKEDKEQQQQQPNGKQEDSKKTEEVKEPPKSESKPTPKKNRSRRSGGGIDLPSQEEAEAATTQGTNAPANDDSNSTQKKGWSSYLPSIPLRNANKTTSDAAAAKQKENSRTWSQYFSVGQGFSSYIPSKRSISSFASSHYRDPSKPLIQQITDFSRTPVGAAGISALSGSGYASSLYAGYSAWTGAGAETPPAMEFLSVQHSRAANARVVPLAQGDTLVSNLREPLLVVVEDTSGGAHDALLAASDPQLYRALGVDGWEEHGSSAENLVLALKELNDRAGLKGPKGIGAEVTVNSVPAPLGLFRSLSWGEDGKIEPPSGAGKSKKGGFIRLRAEKDVVVVMSAGPALDAKGKAKPQDAHFVVEEELDEGEDVRKRLESASNAAQQQQQQPQPKAPGKRTGVPPRKLGRGGQSKPASSGSHTPIGAVKKPKAQAQSGGAQASAQAGSSSAAAAAASNNNVQQTQSQSQQAPQSHSQPQQAQQAQPAQPSQPAQQPQAPAASPQASASSARKNSASTVPSNWKHAGTTSTIDGSSTNSGATSTTQRRKPRKIQRRAPGEAS